jgi:MSHA biogenesis protein MshO
MRYVKKQSGFTLIEMIIVIVITGILAGIISTFITRPIEGYVNLSQRAALVYNAENAIRQMRLDIHSALPNSVRVNTAKNALELLSTVEAMRYRAQPPGDATTRLNFSAADDQFNVFGNFIQLGNLPFTSATYRIAIYNIGALDYSTIPPTPIAGANAYAGPNAAGANVITPAGTTITITDNGNEDHVDINPAFQFSFESPAQRLFVVDTPVSYICDLTAGTLTRYSGYNIQTSQPVPPTSGGSLLAQNITDCSFSYQPGTSQRAAIVSLKIRLKVPGRNDRIQLLQQVHLENVP